MSLTERDVQNVWDKAKEIKNKNPEVYRQDPYGNTLIRRNYGKDSKTGWEIDHIKPVKRGGSDHITNLQALQTQKNRELGDSIVKKSRHNQR